MLNRRNIGRVIGLCPGHCAYKKHLCIMKIVNEVNCRGSKSAEELSELIVCCEISLL